MTFPRRPRIAALAVALSLLPALPAVAQDFDFSDMSPAERAAFGEAVRTYLMENPQVIMEAVAVLESREAEAQARADAQLVRDNLDALVADGYSWVGGNPDGDVTVVEFVDYRCGFCRRAAPEVMELVESDGNIRLVMKEFPILGEASLTSSRFAVATLIVAGDDAYKAVHDALIALEGEPSPPVLRRLAESLGIDADAVMAEMESDEVTRRLRETRALAQRLDINGTPTFVFGDQLVRGYAPLDAMRQIVDGLRSEG
jgi:protein-disulfide isomerase